MQRDLQKRRTTGIKEKKKNSISFIGHNKNDIKGKTIIEKKLYNRIEESFEKLDEQNEEENEDESKNEDESRNKDESKNEDEKENENNNQNEKKPTEKEK